MKLFWPVCQIQSWTFVDDVRGGQRRPLGQGSHGMTRYLISFDDGAMTFPEEELPPTRWSELPRRQGCGSSAAGW